MITHKFDYKELTRTTTEQQRLYHCPDGNALVSVTTILDKTKSAEKTKALANWRRSIGVKTTGCSGMAYVLEFVDTIEEEIDEVFEDHGVKLVVSKKDLVYLNGLQLDYQKKGLNEGFEFINPNVKAECGCGESFTV